MSKKTDKVILNALSALEKRYGEPVVIESGKKVETISSGRSKLDNILGGGFPVGKVIEIYGEEATGKTGLALGCVAKVQYNGGLVGYIDSEHALNRNYCDSIGVNIDDMVLSQPDYGEQAFQIIRTLLNTGKFDLIVVDSVAAMIPKSELEGETGQAMMGLHARMMSQGLKQIIGSANENQTTVIFINQLRDTMAMYGAKKKPTGGNSLKFYAAQRVEIKNKGQVKVGDEVTGFKQLIKVVKNKLDIPFKEIQEDIVFGKGVDKLGEFISALEFEEILVKSGSWYSYDGTNIAQGLKKLRIMLEDNPELVEELEMKLKEKLK